MADAQPSPKPDSIPANITVTLKQEKPPATGADFERTARIVSLVAIPVVLAIIGGVIQATLSKGTVSSDYVKLAVSILTAEKSKTPDDLRGWAVDLLDANSPVKFSKEIADRLKGGEIALPGGVAALLSTSNGSGGMAVSPDGKLVAIAKENEVRIWDLSSGRPVAASLRHSGPITCVAFSPDGKLLASGSEDATVGLWEVATGKRSKTLMGQTDSIIGVAFSPDGREILTRSRDQTISYWDIVTGQVLRRIRLGQ
jgi:WD40 repeat protein